MPMICIYINWGLPLTGFWVVSLEGVFRLILGPFLSIFGFVLGPFLSILGFVLGPCLSILCLVFYQKLSIFGLVLGPFLPTNRSHFGSRVRLPKGGVGECHSNSELKFATPIRALKKDELSASALPSLGMKLMIATVGEKYKHFGFNVESAFNQKSNIWGLISDPFFILLI